MLSPCLPDALIGCLAECLNSATFNLVFGPAGTLAGTVIVMGKFTLSTPLELWLAAETAVADAFCEATEGGKKAAILRKCIFFNVKQRISGGETALK